MFAGYGDMIILKVGLERVGILFCVEEVFTSRSVELGEFVLD